MRDIPSIEYAGRRCGNYGFCRPQIYGVFGSYPKVIRLTLSIIEPRPSCLKIDY
jgi:hypothetical protein